MADSVLSSSYHSLFEENLEVMDDPRDGEKVEELVEVDAVEKVEGKLLESFILVRTVSKPFK